MLAYNKEPEIVQQIKRELIFINFNKEREEYKIILSKEINEYNNSSNTNTTIDERFNYNILEQKKLEDND